MNKLASILFAVALASGLSACNSGPDTAGAAKTAADNITIDNIRMRATPPGQMVTGAFMTLNNGSSQNLTLISANSDIAGVTEVHETTREGEVMKMHKVDKIDIPANGSAELKPGSFHIMLMELKKPVPAGEKANITLTFSDNSQKTIEATAVDINH